MGELGGNSPRLVWQHAGFTKDCEQEKEEAPSLMEKVTPILWVNWRASMELSTSLDPFLINSEAHQNAIFLIFLPFTKF